jgi:hypothetical protein
MNMTDILGKQWAIDIERRVYKLFEQYNISLEDWEITLRDSYPEVTVRNKFFHLIHHEFSRNWAEDVEDTMEFLEKDCDRFREFSFYDRSQTCLMDKLRMLS